MSDTANQANAPPYVPWGTFRNFTNSLREHGLPSQINRSVMSNLSFSAQAQLLAALKSLGLTDAKGAPTEILSEFIHADDSSQSKVLDKIIRSNYDFIFNHLDLSRATQGELESQFRAAGISGSTVGRAIAFFLHAAGNAGIPLSAHIKKNGAPSSSGAARSTRSTRRRRAVGQKAPEGNVQTPTPAPTPPSEPGKTFEEGLLNKFPGFDPNWSDELKKSWFDGFKTLMGMAPQKKSEPE